MLNAEVSRTNHNINNPFKPEPNIVFPAKMQRSIDLKEKYLTFYRVEILRFFILQARETAFHLY
jgi:hypothetical protein